MNQVIIENPILNSPFAESNHHFRFDDEGVTNQMEDARRISCSFIPIPKPRTKAKGRQQTFDGWTEAWIDENVTTAHPLWIPAINNAGTLGRWAFIEITDPWDAQNMIRALLATAPDTAKGDPHAHAT